MVNEYREGPVAKEKFEQAMKTLFQAPEATNPKEKPKLFTLRKSAPPNKLRMIEASAK